MTRTPPHRSPRRLPKRTRASTPSHSGGPKSVRPASRMAPPGNRSTCPAANWSRGWRAPIPQPAAEPAGFIAKHLSADGSHLVFGSTSKFEPDGNEGEVSIYDRNLSAKGVETHVVSKPPAGQTLTEEGDGIGELDISSDGSRIVVGKLVSEEGSAKYWHLYMNVGDSAKTVDLTPGTTHGVLFDGMTADGSKVFFTTSDARARRATRTPIQRRHLRGRSLPVRRRDAVANLHRHRRHREHRCLQPAGEHRPRTLEHDRSEVKTAASSRSAAAAAWPRARDDLLPLAREARRSGQRGPKRPKPLHLPARPAPQFVATLESSGNAPLPPSEHTYIRSFGSFANPTGVAIDHATGDVYVLDSGTNIGTGYVYKFDPAGHPVLNFGTNGKLAVSGMLGFYNMPDRDAVDNDPGSPSYRRSLRPRNRSIGSPSSVKKYTSSGALEGKLEAELPYRRLGQPVERQRLHRQCSAEVCMSTTPRQTDRARNLPDPGIPAADRCRGRSARQRLRRQRRRRSRGQRHDRGLRRGRQLRQTARRQPLLRRERRPGSDDVYVNEGNQVSEFDPPAETASAFRPASASSPARSASESTPATLYVSNPQRKTSRPSRPPNIPCDPETDNPLVDRQRQRAGRPAHRRLPGHALGRRRRLHLDPAADRLRQRPHPPRGLPHMTRRRKVSTAPSCNPTTRAGDRRCGASRRRARPSATTVVSSSTPAKASSIATSTTRKTPTSGSRDGYDIRSWRLPVPNRSRLRRADFNRHQPASLRACSGSAADGADAYFFTRDKLAEEDKNGNAVKIYDARAWAATRSSSRNRSARPPTSVMGPARHRPHRRKSRAWRRRPAGLHARTKCKAGFVKKHGTSVRAPKSKKRHHHHRKGHRHHG